MPRNVIISGGIFHDFAESSRALQATLEPLGVQSIIYTDVNQALADLEGNESRLLTVNALRWRMHGEKYDDYRAEWAFDLNVAGQEIIKRHMARGHALLAMHTASICFDGWPDWKHILGGAWEWGRSYHPPKSHVDVVVVGKDAIVADCPSFCVDDEVYAGLDTVAAISPLLASGDTHEIPGQPLLWKHNYGGGRVIYDALGHDATSILEPTHRRIIQQSAKWLLNVKS